MNKYLLTLIATLFLSPICMHGEEPSLIEASTTDTISYLVLQINKIKELENDTIYGQIIPNSKEKKTYGGKKIDQLKNEFKKINNGQNLPYALEINRDSIRGIFLTIPSAYSDSFPNGITFKLSRATPKNNWSPKQEDPIEICWKTAPTVNETEQKSEIVQPNETESLNKDKGKGLSKVHWILIALLAIIVVYCIYYSKKRTKAKNKNNLIDDADEEAPYSPVKKGVAKNAQQKDIQTNPTFNPEEVANKIAPLLEKHFKDAISKSFASSFDKLQTSVIGAIEEKIKSVNLPQRESATEKPGENIPPVQPPKIEVIGAASCISKERTLILSKSNEDQFLIKKHSDSEYSFVINPSAIKDFETSPAMLDIYKRDGIINFTDISQNAHITIKSPGKLSPAGDGKFKVISPLELSF